MTKVGITGYGTIGQLLAQGISSQRDMELVGVADANPNLSFLALKERGYPYALFNTRRENQQDFEHVGISLSGSFVDLVNEIDVIVDTTSPKEGAEYFFTYQRNHKKAIFQGGKNNSVCDDLFYSLINYEKSMKKQFLKLPIGMVLGLLRSIASLDYEIGVEQVAFTSFSKRERHDLSQDVLHMNLPSEHYVDDFSALFPNVSTMGVQYTTTSIPGELITVVVTSTKTVGADDVCNILRSNKRIRLVKYADGFVGIDALLHYIRHMGSLSSMYEMVVWEELIRVDEKRIMFSAYLPFLSILVPETIDAIRAVTNMQKNYREGIGRTDEYLGIGAWK